MTAGSLELIKMCFLSKHTQKFYYTIFPHYLHRQQNPINHCNSTSLIHYNTISFLGEKTPIKMHVHDLSPVYYSLLVQEEQSDSDLCCVEPAMTHTIPLPC